MTDQFPDDPAEQAARTWFAQEASGAAPGSIDPAVVRAAADRKQRLRFTGLLAAAAVLVAALVIIPLALRPADPPITGVPAPSAEPTWTTTATSPLSPRFGSLAAWLNGRFYVMGGWDGGPCPPGSLCDMIEPNLRDGAAYDPATDSWTTIAEAPFPIGRDFAEGVAHQGAFYVQSGIGGGAFWVYHPEADQWQQLARPPSYGQLVATSSMIVVNSYDGAPAHHVYQPATDSWEPLPAGPIDSCDGWSAQAAEERLLVIGRCGVELRTSFYDPATGVWSEPGVVPEITLQPTSEYGGNLVHVAGKLLWPSALWVFSSTRTPGIYDLESQTWRDVSVDSAPGGLAFRGLNPQFAPVVLEDLGLVEANGNLLDVRTATWLTVPEAPVPDRWDPVVAAGSGSLLSCFGYHYSDDSFEGGRFAAGCQLLTVAPTAPRPTDAPVNPTEAPTSGAVGLAWREISSPDSNPRSEALLVAVNDDFYLMGGYRPPGPDEDGEQIAVGYRFDPDYGDGWTAWAAIAALPELALSRPYRLSADVVGDTIYVHFTFEEMGELWAYDTAVDRWRKIGDSDEGDYFVGTEDGLVKIQSIDDSLPHLHLLSDGQWVELPAPPMGRGAFRLGDHQLGYLTADYRLAVLDTATRSWLAPSEPGEIGSHEVFGVDGAAVFVYRPDSEGELMPNHKYGLNVVTLVDGTWTNPDPMLTDGGLGSEIGAVAGRWIVISGNLFDPHTQEWLSVPAIPGSDYQWVSPTVAGSSQGVLSCSPIRAIDEPEPRVLDSCYFLAVP